MTFILGLSSFDLQLKVIIFIILRRFKTISHRQWLVRFPKWLDLYRVKLLNGKRTLVHRLWIARFAPSMCWSVAKIVRFGFWIFVMVHRFCPYCICQVQSFNLSLYVATFWWRSWWQWFLSVFHLNIAEHQQWIGRRCYRMWSNSCMESSGRINLYKGRLPWSVSHHIDINHTRSMVLSCNRSRNFVCHTVKWMRLFVQQTAWDMVNWNSIEFNPFSCVCENFPKRL